MTDGNENNPDEELLGSGKLPSFISQAIPDVLLVEPRVQHDERGFFFESYNSAAWKEAGVKDDLAQDNHSFSTGGVLRGLHAQLERPQAKLVRVIEGEIYDVAVDIRPGSPSFGQWVAAVLSAENFRQLYIPPGFAHGFCVQGARAQVAYKVSGSWDPTDEITIAWNDPQLAIDWPVERPVISEKDRRGVSLAEVSDRLCPSDGEAES
jgi:dTDP-4-dehydrorhamnose 3,5-epimerase